jgi:uncharacterized membrane protein YphA (DoxX/SURF4 family)
VIISAAIQCANCVQRLFSGFPSGWAGYGLIALRVALAFHLTIEAGRQLIATAEGPPGPPSIARVTLGVLHLLCAGAVLAGFLTPIVQLVIGATSVGIIGYQVWAAGWGLPLEWWQSSSCVPVLAMGLAMLGPGAYSVDARMFGRQEIVLGPGPALRR